MRKEEDNRYHRSVWRQLVQKKCKISLVFINGVKGRLYTFMARSTQEVHTCWLDCGRDSREPSWRGSGVPSGSTFTWHLQVVVARVLVAVAVTSPASASVQSVSRSVHVPYWSLSGKGGKTLHKQDPDKQSAQKRTLGANDFSAAMSCSGTHFQDLT